MGNKLLSPLDYYVDYDDLDDPSISWAAKVMQVNYSKMKESSYSQEFKLVLDFKRWAKTKVKNWRGKSLEVINLEIQERVTRYKTEYPESFPVDDFGWWTKKQLYKLWSEGKLTLEGYNIEAELATRAALKDKLRQEKEELEAERVRLAKEREDSRLPLVKGMKLRRQADVYSSFGFNSVTKSAKAVVEEHVKVSLVNGGTGVGKYWLVEEVWKEGGRCYRDGLLDK